VDGRGGRWRYRVSAQAFPLGVGRGSGLPSRRKLRRLPDAATPGQSPDVEPSISTTGGPAAGGRLAACAGADTILRRERTEDPGRVSAGVHERHGPLRSSRGRITTPPGTEGGKQGDCNGCSSAAGGTLPGGIDGALTGALRGPPLAEVEHVERETESYVAWVIVLGFVAYALALYWADRCNRRGGDPVIRFSVLRGFIVKCYK
jgi:hypothetical protein